MRRLSEIKGEEAVDVLAELMTPVTEILADRKVAAEYKKKNKKVASIVALAVKDNKDSLIDVLCLLADQSREEYLKTANVISIVSDAMYVMNDPVMKELFIGQGQMLDDAGSGSATESVESGN